MKPASRYWAALVLVLHAVPLSWLWFDQVPARQRVAAPVVEVSLAQPNVASDHDGAASVAQQTADSALPSGDTPSSMPSDADAVLHTAPHTFLPARELDERPYPQEPVVVPYPDAVLGKAYGSVILLLQVDARGSVQHVSVVRSDVPQAFEKAAVEAFSGARMVPGQRGGQSVGAEMKIAVDFGQP